MTKKPDHTPDSKDEGTENHPEGDVYAFGGVTAEPVVDPKNFMINDFNIRDQRRLLAAYPT